jgi:nucleotide-binding universal stress UspA family protein
MSYRIILVPLFGTDADATALHAGFTIGRRFDAHIMGLFVRIDPRDVIPVVGEGVSAAVIEQLMQASEAETNRRRDAAKERFYAAVSGAGVQVVERSPGAGGLTAQWTEVTGRREDILPRRARLADLTVFTRLDEDAALDQPGLIEATLLGSGRPLLLTPAAAPQSLGHAVAIAWNGSAEAARALAYALPLIESANAVHVLTAATAKTEFDLSAELAEYLEWRGITCERRPVSTDGEVGAALLSTAADAGADLLVMGGYGRSRLRELVLGGVTRHVLAHAELPIFLAH